MADCIEAAIRGVSKFFTWTCILTINAALNNQRSRESASGRGLSAQQISKRDGAGRFSFFVRCNPIELASERSLLLVMFCNNSLN